MRRPLLTRLVLLSMALAIPGAARAGVPSPFNSTLPACMALCPLGDLPFTVVVRDIANGPVAGSVVVLDFSQCPGAHICEPWGYDPYTVNVAARTILATTDAAGAIVFPARVGGTGAAGSVRVYADGVFLKAYALASPDQDGTGAVYDGPPVGGNDIALFTPKLGTTDRTADFTCDGLVNEDDRIIEYYHYGQSCLGWIDPAKKSTWGELKTHYR